MLRNIVIIITLALLTTSFALGQESAQIMVVAGKIHQDYQWIFNEDDAEVLVSLQGPQGEKFSAVLYPESVAYAKIFSSFSGYVARVGDNVTVFVSHEGTDLWTNSHTLNKEDINSGVCVVDIKPIQEENNQSSIMVIAGHIDETFQGFFNDPVTEIIISLGDTDISGKVVDDGWTYTGVFITLDNGYVAEIGDIVTVAIYKDGINLWERSRQVTQEEIKRTVIVIDLGQVITNTGIRGRRLSVTWGSLKR